MVIFSRPVEKFGCQFFFINLLFSKFPCISRICGRTPGLIGLNRIITKFGRFALLVLLQWKLLSVCLCFVFLCVLTKSLLVRCTSCTSVESVKENLLSNKRSNQFNHLFKNLCSVFACTLCTGCLCRLLGLFYTENI